MQALNKTKAALQSRSCQFTASNLSFQDITVIDQVNSEAGNHVLGTGIPVSLSHTALSGKAMRVTHSHAQKILKGSLVGIGYKESLSVSRASLRWRRLISPRNAETINDPVVSPGSFTFSISSMTSCGTREAICVDLLLLRPVAMTNPQSIRWLALYMKKGERKELRWLAPLCKVVSTLSGSRYENSEARQCVNTNRASDHNVNEGYIMAELQSTQTRPLVTYNTKFFTWRFLAVPVSHPEARPIVLYRNASTETEARQGLPGWLLFFAARLPLFTPEIKGVNRA